MFITFLIAFFIAISYSFLYFPIVSYILCKVDGGRWTKKKKLEKSRKKVKKMFVWKVPGTVWGP